jgi:hypothetical protein
VKSPGENHWTDLFGKIDSPALILLDEMPTYFASLLNSSQLAEARRIDVAGRAFANMLTAAMIQRNICIVVSDLERPAEGTQIINVSYAAKTLVRTERVRIQHPPVGLAAWDLRGYKNLLFGNATRGL